MEAVAADLPLYLQMSRYTKGSKAVMELRVERFLADQAATATKSDINDDNLITGSLPDADIAKETAATTDDDGFSFNDFLDMINPLQHLPVVSTLYREMTGDEIDPASRIVGGALYGGPIGAGISVAEAVLEQATGDDLSGHVMSMLQGSAPSPAVAAVAPSATEPEAPSAPANTVALSTSTNAPPPSLSAEAFNALLTKPEDDAPAARPRQHFAAHAEQDAQDAVAAAMALALDRYEVLKLVDEPAY